MASEVIMILPSYSSGLLQIKAYRQLKSYVNKHLSTYDLSMAEWAILGRLFEVPDGERLATLAEMLAVEPPLVTLLVDGIEARGLVKRAADPDDRRAKRICLTPSGTALVQKVEKHIHGAMQELLADVTSEDLLAYTRVLEEISAKATA